MTRTEICLSEQLETSASASEIIQGDSLHFGFVSSVVNVSNSIIEFLNQSTSELFALIIVTFFVEQINFD